jgi:hypothetical protein
MLFTDGVHNVIQFGWLLMVTRYHINRLRAREFLSPAMNFTYSDIKQSHSITVPLSGVASGTSLIGPSDVESPSIA